MGLDLSAAVELNDRLNTGKKVPYLKLGQGKHALRILPPPPGMKLPWLEYKRCSDVGPNKKFVVPPNQFDPSEPDVIGEEIARLEALGDEASLKRAKEMRPRTTWAIFVIDRAHEGMGPQLWSATQTHIQALLTFIANPDAGGDITDPEEGRDVIIDIQPNAEGKTFRGKVVMEWKFAVKLKATPLGNPAWLSENLFEKWKIGRPSDTDYIRACIAGTEKDFVEQRKQERDARKAADEEVTPAEGASSALPQGDAAVRQKLEEIRQRTVKPQDSTRSGLGNFLG